MASGGAWATGGRVITAFTALATNALLARLLSPQDLGVYFLAFSIVQVGALLGSLGLEQAVVRFVAESIGLNQFERARHALVGSLMLGTLGALGVGAVYLLLGRTLAGTLFHAPGLVAASGLVAGWIAVMTLQALVAGAFQSFHDLRLSTIFGGLTTGILLTASLGVLWLLVNQSSLAITLLLAVGSGFANVLLAGWLLRRKVASLPPSDSVSSPVRIGTIMGVALPLSVSNVTVFALAQADLWIIGAFRPPEEVAIYGAAVRAVVLVAMPLVAVNAIAPPLIAELYAQGRRQELERALRAAATLAGIPAFLVLASFLIFGGPILALVFGDYYSQGATILRLLSLAQLVNVWSGVSMTTLAYTGNQTVMMLITIAGGLVTIIAGLGAVGPYGATGVAVTAAVGISAYNVALWLVARRKTRLWTHVGFGGFSELMGAARRIAAGRGREGGV
jgi:O-antigen/teichoic acid export membrane protein